MCRSARRSTTRSTATRSTKWRRWVSVKPSDTILPKAHWACDPTTVNYYTYDPDKAKKLLADAGHPDGIEIETIGWADQTAMQRQEMIISQLAKAGIRVKLTPMSPQQAMQAFMIDKKGAMFISADLAPSPIRASSMRTCSARTHCAMPGASSFPVSVSCWTPPWIRRTRTPRKAAFAKLQRFTVENALSLVAVYCAGHRRDECQGAKLQGRAAGDAEVHGSVALGLSVWTARDRNGENPAIDWSPPVAIAADRRVRDVRGVLAVAAGARRSGGRAGGRLRVRAAHRRDPPPLRVRSAVPRPVRRLAVACARRAISGCRCCPASR